MPVAIAYRKLVERFRLDGCCYLGQHFVEVKTGCTGTLQHVLREEKRYNDQHGGRRQRPDHDVHS